MNKGILFSQRQYFVGEQTLVKIVELLTVLRQENGSIGLSKQISKISSSLYLL